MSYQMQLAETKLELDKVKADYRSYCINSQQGYDWDKRRAYEESVKKLKAKISRLESKVILSQGPVTHHDLFGQAFTPGARVVWSDSGRYAGFGKIWYVSYCTAKQVSLVADPSDIGNPGTKTDPEYLLVVDKLMVPPPAPKGNGP